MDFEFSFGLVIPTYWASVLLVFFSAALFKSVLGCAERERLATSWLNGVCSFIMLSPRMYIIVLVIVRALDCMLCSF